MAAEWGNSISKAAWRASAAGVVPSRFFRRVPFGIPDASSGTCSSADAQCAIEHYDDARSVRDASERVGIVLHQQARKHAAAKRRVGIRCRTAARPF